MHSRSGAKTHVLSKQNQDSILSWYLYMVICRNQAILSTISKEHFPWLGKQVPLARGVALLFYTAYQGDVSYFEVAWDHWSAIYV